MNHVNGTHAPSLESWVESANLADADFPIQNLPFGRFRRPEDSGWCIGVAIGDQVLDLRKAELIDSTDMNRLMRLTSPTRRLMREAISHGLRKDSEQRAKFEAALVPQMDVELGLPCEIRDYTDFYVGIHHATAVGKLFRPDAPLLPNYKYVPIGYHGRASTINVSGHGFHRPMGQLMSPGASHPVMKVSERLDIELELGIFISRPNAQGLPIAIEAAEEHVFGMALFNDWSARDIQAWEYQPLGPFLSKNFASTVSPWVVTMEALAPFRTAFTRPDSDPQPLPYLDSPANREHGAIDVELEVWLQTPAMREAGNPGDCISRSNFAQAAYWTVAQLVAHHTVNGCSLSCGDLFGSGTLSGPKPEQAGSLLELTQGGKQQLQLSNGEQRTFLLDGDTVTLRGFCQREGFRRIGFGECQGTVLPSTNGSKHF
ncbi:fumarylacetoacetase [Polaromonas sp.]|uniref:fumarylacetoacetase n=1 Tax=Polaromonas sp. TaxID=1869339 RepID=UPI003264F1C3